MPSEDPRTHQKSDPPHNTKPDVTFQEDTTSDEESEKKKETWHDYTLIKFIANEFAWVAPKTTFASLKPVIRSAVSAWVCLVLLVVPETAAAIGQAAFLILIGAFLSPPNDPFAAVLEREVVILLSVCLAWAWSVLGVKFASLARSEIKPNATSAEIFTGQFIELGPGLVLGAFLALGSAFFMFMKAKLGPGPFLFGTIFGCIALDIILTTSALYPYPNYILGQTIAIPLAVHSAVSLVCSIVVFPETVNAQYAKRMRAVLLPLAQGIRSQPEFLKKSPFDAGFDPAPFKKIISQAETTLLPLNASLRLLRRDFSYGRFSAGDLKGLHEYVRRLAVRADGLSFFYRILDPLREPFPATPAPSRSGTPAHSVPATPTVSRPGTPNGHPSELFPENSEQVPDRDTSSTHQSTTDHGTPNHVEGHEHFPMSGFKHLGNHFGLRHPHPYSHSTHHHRHRRPHAYPPSLLHEALNQSLETQVGVFESQRYMNLEARLHNPRGDLYVERTVTLLGESTENLLLACADSLDHAVSWLERLNSHRFLFLPLVGTKKEKDLEKMAQEEEEMASELERAIEKFKAEDRLRVLAQYLDVLARDTPPHRYLFQSFVYQFHLLEFAKMLLNFMMELARLEKERSTSRLWTPKIPWRTFFDISSEKRAEFEDEEHGADDENPESIPGMHEKDDTTNELDAARRRDPDALPPSNRVELMGTWLFAAVAACTRGNVLFAIKAGALSALLSIPSYYHSTAIFAYKEKWIWAIFMSQLTIARFRGDTAFGLVSRLVATSIGGVLGMIVWYISSGDGGGNAYALCTVCAVAFPAFMFFRLYFPGPPIVTIISFVTLGLVVGYSWQDTHQPTLSSPGYGFDVAWRRFVLVTIGVTAAFISSFLPPSTTIRQYHRVGHATTTAELGNILCAVISLANAHDKIDQPALVKNLIAIRSKLKRSKAAVAYASYEFSLRGKWPAKRYEGLLELQLQIAYLLSHLYTIVERLDPTWSRAFLRRTRLTDSDFIGDVLAVISMCSSALRTGIPLPQITPAPLLDRFLLPNHGFNVIHPESEVDYGLPKKITAETLGNDQYMVFSVGVATAYGIVTRLDRLVFSVKELVGERFHVNGIGLTYTQHPHDE